MYLVIFQLKVFFRTCNQTQMQSGLHLGNQKFVADIAADLQQNVFIFYSFILFFWLIVDKLPQLFPINLIKAVFKIRSKRQQMLLLHLMVHTVNGNHPE